jgi:hypothetical protein
MLLLLQLLLLHEEHHWVRLHVVRAEEALTKVLKKTLGSDYSGLELGDDF